MSFIQTVAAADATGELREMYLRQQQSWGYVPAYARAFSARPELMTLWARLLAGIRRSIAPRRFELATVAAAVALGNTACALAHGRALCKYLPGQAVREIALSIREQRTPRGLSAEDTAIVRFAARAALRSNAIDEQDIAALRACGLGDDEIFDLAATVAGRAFFAGLLGMLGVEADAPLGELVPELRAALSVGRPVSDREPQRIEECCAEPA